MYVKLYHTLLMLHVHQHYYTASISISSNFYSTSQPLTLVGKVPLKTPLRKAPQCYLMFLSSRYF